jgi:tetraacyldisaccharide 4'-kinase
LQNEADRRSPQQAFNGTVDAVAGIAQPQNFFRLLRDYGLDIHPHAFPDHHNFTIADLDYGHVVIMTEKDAVKCRRFARSDWWVLEWNAHPGEELTEWLAEAVRR